MKTLKGLFLVLVVTVLLSGCKQEEIDIEQGNIYTKENLQVINNTINYETDVSTLTTYEYALDVPITYLDLEEYIKFLGNGLLNYSYVKGDTLEVTYSFYLSPEMKEITGEETIDYTMVFNAEDNTITLDDFDMLTRLNYGYSINVNGDMDLYDVVENDVDTQIVIDLDDYGFEILKEDNQYYLPLYLANLFLSGASLNLIELNDAVILFDYGVDPDTFEAYFDEYPELSFDDVKEDTTKYLKLYFDYFYGLKDYKEIDSFITYIDSFQLDETETLEDYHEEVNDFLFSLDDLHTRSVSVGNLLGDYEEEDNLLVGSKINTYYESSYQNGCNVYHDEFYYEALDDTTHLVKVIDFTSDTGVLFEEITDQINTDDTVVIDISCNAGGSLQGVVELLSFMTDEPIPVSHINSLTGKIIDEFYTRDEPSMLDVDFILITSKVSYSAANVFATIVKDMELAVIIGEDTLGGSSALVYTVLPNGVVISISSHMTFINEDYEIKDDGVEVDIEHSLPFSNDTLLSSIGSYYKLGTSYVVDPVIRDYRLRMVFDIVFQDDIYDNVSYTLTVSNQDGGTIYSSVYSNEFSEFINFDTYYDSYTIELIVEYDYMDNTYIDTLFYQEVQ